MTRSLLTRGALLTAAGLVLPLAACSSGGSDSSTATSSTSSRASSTASSAASSAASSTASSTSAAVAGQPFGPGCGQVPASGPGSVQAMSTAPVATAASTNPELTTLVQAVTVANLVDTLNSTQNITVFAPSNAAFQALPADQRSALMSDSAKLTAVLTHHVVSGRRTPQQVTGALTTLDNDRVTVTGSGESLTISGDQTLSGQTAHVVCGGIQTANATVYIVDQVLKPQNLR